MSFCRRIPLKERKNVSRRDRTAKARDDESETITSFDSFIFCSPSDGGSDHRDERYITLDHASVVPPPFDRSLIAKRDEDDEDDPVPRISPYRKKVPIKRPSTKSPRRKRMRCINVPRVGISFDTEKTSRLKSEFMERLQNEKKARLGKNYQPGSTEPTKMAAKPERQVPSMAQRVRAREKNSQFFMLTGSTVDGRKTAEKSQDVVDNEYKDVISCSSFVTNNPTAAASMSAQLWTVICNSKSVSMRQLPICKARSSSKGIFYRGRRAKYNLSPTEALQSPHALNKRYKDSPEIVNAVNDWILNYDTRCDESTDTVDIAPEPKNLTRSTGAYYSSLKFSADRQNESRGVHPVYSVGNYNIGTKRSFVSCDPHGVTAGSRELNRLLCAREKHYVRGGVGPSERQSPSTKHASQRKRSSHGYSKSGRRRSSHSMCSSKAGDLRSKIANGRAEENERSNNRCESVESGTCDDDTAKITKTLEPDGRRQDVVVCRPFLHKAVSLACEKTALGEVVCASPNKTLNNSNQKEEKSPQGDSQISTVSDSPETRFGDTYTNDAGNGKQTGAHSAGKVSYNRQATAQKANVAISAPVSSAPAANQSLKNVSRCRLRRHVSAPKTRADKKNAGQQCEEILVPGSIMTRFSSASPVSCETPQPAASGATIPSYGTNDDPASPPSVKKTRIKKLVRTLPRQAPRRKNIKKALSVTSVGRQAGQSKPKKERSPSDQEPGQNPAGVSGARIISQPGDGGLGYCSPDKSDEAYQSAAASTTNTTTTHSSEHQANETFTILPKLNHRSRKKRIPSKRPAGDVSETSGSAGDTVVTDSDTRDYDPKSTTSCNTSNIFSIIHEIVGDKRIQKIAPPVIETTAFAEPWPTPPKIKRRKEKKMRTPPAVKKRKPLKLYKRYRIPPKKTCVAAAATTVKENAAERKVSAPVRISHRHRRSLNPTKKLTRASAMELKCPVRVEQLSHRPARSQNGNKVVNQPAKKNVKTGTTKSPTVFSDKGVQVKRYSSDESKPETPTLDFYNNSPLDSEQIKSTVHKRLYSIRTASAESIKSEAVPKHHEDFQRFIAMTRHAQSDISFERLSDQGSPQSHGEAMDKKGSSVDAPDTSSPRKGSNELDFSGAQTAGLINTTLSNGEANLPDVPGAGKTGTRQHRHGVRMAPDNVLQRKENVYLKMLFNGGIAAPQPHQISLPSDQKSDLSSSVDPLVYESARDPRRLSSPRTSVPYAREELKLSIPDAFLPYIRRAREYYVISQTLLDPQYKHMMRGRVSKSKEGSAPTSMSNVSQGKSVSTAYGSRKSPGSRENTVKPELNAPRPQSKARKNVSKETSPNRKSLGPLERTKKQQTSSSRSSPIVVKQASSSPRVKAKVTSPILIPKVSSEKTVHKASITKLSAPRQVAKQFAARPTLPVQQKKRSESTGIAALLKNRTETMAKRSLSKEQPIRAANLVEGRITPAFDGYASAGGEKKTPPRKSSAKKVSSASTKRKERPLKQPPQAKAKDTAPKDTSVSADGSENTLTNSSGDEKYKEPPSEAALRQTLAYLNYVKTGTRLKFPENDIQMIKYLSTSEPTLFPVGTPSALRQAAKKTKAQNWRSTAPPWNEKGSHAKLRKVEATGNGASSWRTSPSTNEKGNSQASSKQKNRRVKKLNKKTTGTNSTNNKYMKSTSSSSVQSKGKSKSRPPSSTGPSYGSEIWQQPSNLRENLLLLSALNRCRNNSDRASDGIKDSATLYDLQSELSGRNVYIPKVLQNMIAEREKSQSRVRLSGKKKPRADSAKFGTVKRNRKARGLQSKRATGKLTKKTGGNSKQVSLTSRRPVKSQTVTSMIKKTLTGKDAIGKSIHGLVSDLKSISKTLESSPSRKGNFKVCENRPVLARKLEERMLERNNTHTDSSVSTLNSSQTTVYDSELTSEESGTVTKEGFPEAGVNDNDNDPLLGSSGIMQGGRKIWSAAYDRVLKMLSGKKSPTEPKHKSRQKNVKKRDAIPATVKTPSAEKVSKRILDKPPSSAFEPKYLHVARDAILSKLNPAADPKSCALFKLGTELSRAGTSKSGKVGTRPNSTKRRVAKTPKEKQARKIPVSRYHM